jgi:hypothetical protein
MAVRLSGVSVKSDRIHNECSFGDSFRLLKLNFLVMSAFDTSSQCTATVVLAMFRYFGLGSGTERKLQLLNVKVSTLQQIN